MQGPASVDVYKRQDKRYARAQLPDGKLGELVDLVSTIGFGDDPGKARDVLGLSLIHI